MTSTLGADLRTPDDQAARLSPAITGSARRVTQRTTVLPRQVHGSPATPRSITAFSQQDAQLLGGALVSSLCTTMLLFGRLTPWSGRLGFTLVFVLVFIVEYAGLSSLSENRQAVVDRVMTVLLTAAAMVAMVALFSVVVFTFKEGWDALKHLNFYTEDLRVTGPEQPLDTGGVLHSIVGTLIMTGLSLVFTVPLAITCAVFLNEGRGRFVNVVRTIVTAMTALPSIVAGLFVFATWVLVLGFPRSGLAASISVSIMMLPIIVRSADVVLRLVPGNLREAASALGAPQWRVVWHVVLPTARSGLITSVILGVARGVGETAPVLLTSGYATTMNLDPTSDPMGSLPVTAFKLVSSPVQTQIARGFGAASVLMIIVLVLFTLARVLGGRPAGRLSKAQLRRRAVQSIADLDRIETGRLDGRLAGVARTAQRSVPTAHPNGSSGGPS